jgi:hypothetical protein
MTIWIKFAGWFQCRLATDPDPSDEPRGVSGYIRAVAGEPDLDRIIRLQPSGATQRFGCPDIGVKVVEVLNASTQKPSPLIGAAVDLLDNPKFEGRNHVTAKDGYEAVYPLHFRISKDKLVLQRRYDDSLKYPPRNDADRQSFASMQPTGINMSPGAIGEATGIFDLAPVWSERRALLEKEMKASADPVVRAAHAARIASMSIMTDGPNPRPASSRYFSARMLYAARLGGTSIVQDPDNYLPAVPDVKAPWVADFWMGAWDADAMCGYMVGYLGVPLTAGAPLTRELGEAIIHPALRRG